MVIYEGNGDGILLQATETRRKHGSTGVKFLRKKKNKQNPWKMTKYLTEKVVIHQFLVIKPSEDGRVAKTVGDWKWIKKGWE